MNIADPNIYEYITNFADDRTILTMLSVNKKFRDENLFRRVIIRKYPLLIEFKKPNETWQHFFVQMTYYIHKLQEDYDIPYIPTKGYDPRILINREDKYNEGMYYAALGGWLDLVKFFINKGADAWGQGMYYATRGGSLDLVKFFIDKGATNWESGMRGAVQGGSLDLVKFFVNKGAKNWEGGMFFAAEGGSLDLINFFINKGAKNWDIGMSGAAQGGHQYLVDFFKRKLGQ